jgi:folate-binding Fe-S cluster repair protein YgfZ
VRPRTSSSSSSSSTGAGSVRWRGSVANLSSRRAVVHVYGADVMPFLNGLVTSGLVAHPDRWTSVGNDSMMGTMLNSKGRMLADALLMWRGRSKSFFIEADRQSIPNLLTHLRKYKLRSSIHIESDAAEAYSVYSLLATDPSALKSLIVRLSNTKSASQCAIYPDPRWPLSLRIIAPSNSHRTHPLALCIRLVLISVYLFIVSFTSISP